MLDVKWCFFISGLAVAKLGVVKLTKLCHLRTCTSVNKIISTGKTIKMKPHVCRTWQITYLLWKVLIRSARVVVFLALPLSSYLWNCSAAFTSVDVLLSSHLLCCKHPTDLLRADLLFCSHHTRSSAAITSLLCCHPLLFCVWYRILLPQQLSAAKTYILLSSDL